MRVARALIFGALIVLLFFEILVGFPIKLEWGGDSTDLKEESFSQSNEAEKKMEGVHLVESRSGNRDWELFAEKAEEHQGKSEWELQNVKILFYKEDSVQFTVVGKTGKIDTKTKDLLVAGDVVTKSNNGYQFQTNSINYDSKKRVLESHDKVKMSGPSDGKKKGLLVEGGMMVTQVDDHLMTIKNDVRAQRSLSNGKNVIIRSGEAQFSNVSNSAKFLERVSVELDSMKMEGPAAEFFYQPGADLLQSINMHGGVRMSDFDKFATSDSVKFDPSDNKFTLTGKPRVVQNSDEIMGDQIIFLDGGKKVKVEKMRARVEKSE
ncbi:MAG: hypothetical protein BroJett040_17730 [Oligoflexia bacterium]|nr:MAG: hypothetical protein BroJett040_17730 [Oligoflexia bacterium]